jgi:hypothetical protein
MTKEQEEAIAAAVRAAIEEMGVAEFKKTSFFMSNRRDA